ncbi:hypothetical protein GGR55DRAFT_151603 [Xylaria sp. FL0064]|nr:hypothetical protein GGR55DRAFT_151603 [Xylaria sp. FL0064]
MFSRKYRHKCTKCGSTRSRRFHRRYPAGPNHPEAKGVCRRCRLRADVIEVQIHHHHHHYHGQLREPDEPLPQNCGDHPFVTHSMAHSFSSIAYPHTSPRTAEPPPVYSELPSSQYIHAAPRVELAAGHGLPARELLADSRGMEQQQPAGGRKPKTKRLGHYFGRLFKKF